MKCFLLILLIFFSCSTKKDLSKEQGIQEQEEQQEASHWLIDPFRFSCTRYPLTIDEMSSEFEKLTGSPCEVTIIDSPKGPIRSFACGDTTWFVTNSESTCQAAVEALKLPDTGTVTWMLIPGEDQCESIPGNIGQVVDELEKQNKVTCQIKQLNAREPSARHIDCGEKNWILSEDAEACQRLQDFYNQYKKHNI